MGAAETRDVVEGAVGGGLDAREDAEVEVVGGLGEGEGGHCWC